MSAPRVALLPRESDSPPSPFPPRGRWWERLTCGCGGIDWPYAGKFWSAWVHESSAVEFEGRWYCSISCLKSAVAFRVHSLLAGFRQERPRAFRLPLGLLLISRGALSQEQLRLALHKQREIGRGRIGDWLLQLDMVTEEQLVHALRQQWACPIFPLDLHSANLSCGDLLPIPLLESACAVPAYASPDGRLVHLAFADCVDHTLLYAVEQMLGCRTVACVASPTAIAHMLDHLRRSVVREETSFDTVRDPGEVPSTTSSYSQELQPPRTAIPPPPPSACFPFPRQHSSRDLLFRVLPVPPASFTDRLISSTKGFSISADR